MDQVKVYYCCDCKKVRENPKKSTCKACSIIRNDAYRARVKAGHIAKPQTGLCPCGSERAVYSPSYCGPCASRIRAQWNRDHPPTREQQDHINELQNKRYVKKRGPRKEKPDPSLWVKPERVKKEGTRVNGIPVLCARPNCNNTEGILSNGWCKPCAAAYQRERIKYHHLPERSEESKIKGRVRALTNSYIKAGKLSKGPCEVCGTNENVESHHDDYTKPMDIRWLCRKHHREHHRNEKLTEK